jgi:hypothetical protein
VEPETKDARYSFARQYSDSIQISRFNPDNVPSTDQAKVMKNVEPVGSTATAEARAYAALYIALRRGCKFGIGMVATEKVFAAAKVHFILDLIDMTTVCGKRAGDSRQKSDLTPKPGPETLTGAFHRLNRIGFFAI